MRITLDTEFTGLSRHATLISIGMVSETGRSFYTELSDFDRTRVDEFVRDNVFPLLGMKQAKYHKFSTACLPQFPVCSATARGAIERWLRSTMMDRPLDEKIEFWADCGHYDWVLFSDLMWGNQILIDPRVQYCCRDLGTLLAIEGLAPCDTRRVDMLGAEAHYDLVMTFPLDTGDVAEPKHHALFDAMVTNVLVEWYHTSRSDWDAAVAQVKR